MEKLTSLFLSGILILLSSAAEAQQPAEIIKFEDYQARIASSKKPLTVINFWATWCAPCIKELPYFNKLYVENPERIDLVLVNLDFADKIEKVNEFIVKKNLQGDVLLLDEIDYNSWIDRVEPSWSGAIPASIFINNRSGKRIFIEGEIDEARLRTIIDNLENQTQDP